MALPIVPTSSTITGYGAPFRTPVISRQDQLWVEIYAMVVLLNNAGGTNYINALGTLHADAAKLTAGMSVEEIESALTGTYSTEANVIDSTNFPSPVGTLGVGNVLAKIATTRTRTYDDYVRCLMLLRYQLLRLKSA